MGFSLSRYITRRIVLPYAIGLTISGVYYALTQSKPINLEIFKEPIAHFTSAFFTLMYNSYKMVDDISHLPRDRNRIIISNLSKEETKTISQDILPRMTSNQE